jgi:hypothetical protein
MNLFVRKVVTAGATATAALALTGGAALAHECYNASRSDQGNAAAAKSQALVSAEEALSLFCGLDAEESAIVLAQLEEQGFETGFLINSRALMAGGLEKNGKGGEKLHDGQAIDHLGEDFFGALVALAPSCA